MAVFNSDYAYSLKYYSNYYDDFRCRTDLYNVLKISRDIYCIGRCLMTRKILIALCVLFVMPVFVITGCDEVQENLTPKSSFIADFSCEYRKMNITGKLSASGKKLINISLDSPNTVSGLSVTYKGSDLEISRENMICSADEAYIPESSFPNITKEILYGIADGRAVFEGKCEDVCTYRLDSAFGKAVVSTNSKGCISKISVDGEDYEMVLSNVKDANG